jgi:hypothetical protein
MRAHPPSTVTACWITAALAALMLSSGDAGAALPLKAITISNSLDSVSEFRPRIQGDAVVWQRGSGTGSEVMRRDGYLTVNLTSNGVADENPETDGIHVVWQQGSAGGRNIATFDLLTGTTTILSSPGDETFPLVSGTNLAWIQMVDADGEVFVDPGPVGNQLTGNALVESEFTIDGENLVWAEGDDLHQTPGTADDSHNIAVWNGALQGLYILTGPGTDDIHPAISGDTVVWQAGPDGSGDIWYGDTQGTANPLYDGGTDERNPQTDGARVIWQHFDEIDFDLYIVDLASPNSVIPFTNDALDDVTPQIDGNNIVWVKEVTPGDSEIWVSWNNGPLEPLRRTQHNGRDDVAPRLDGDHFVYESCVNLGQPGELCDVVLVPEPRATLGVAAALMALAFLASRSARRATVPAQIPRRR